MGIVFWIEKNTTVNKTHVLCQTTCNMTLLINL
jgi:hypothetical protein